MPERNGIETTSYIRAFESAKHRKRVPIVGLTGHESEEIKQTCIQSGMNAVLEKPIKKQDIIDLLKSYL